MKGIFYRGCNPEFLTMLYNLLHCRHMHQPYYTFDILLSPQHSPVGLLPQYKMHRSKQQERLTYTMPVMYVMPACSWSAQRLSSVWPTAPGACQHPHVKVWRLTRSSSTSTIIIKIILCFFLLLNHNFNLCKFLSIQQPKAVTAQNRCCTAKYKNTT